LAGLLIGRRVRFDGLGVGGELLELVTGNESVQEVQGGVPVFVVQLFEDEVPVVKLRVLHFRDAFHLGVVEEKVIPADPERLGQLLEGFNGRYDDAGLVLGDGIQVNARKLREAVLGIPPLHPCSFQPFCEELPVSHGEESIDPHFFPLDSASNMVNNITCNMRQCKGY